MGGRDLGRGELIRQAVFESASDLILDGRLEEPFRASVRKGLDTACWAWAGGRHRVFVGDGVLDRSLPGLTTDELKAYVSKFLHHERGHALYTERDAELVQRELSSRGVPFGLWNLVEDARIEHRYRQDSEEGFMFSWLLYEQAPALQTVVLAKCVEWAFFYLIQAEGRREDIEAISAKMGVDEKRAVEDGVGFYEQAVRSRGSLGAMAVAQAMMAKYPELAAVSGRCGLQMGMSMGTAEGSATLEAFEKDDEGGAVKAEDEGPAGQKNGSGLADGTDLLSEQAQIVLDLELVESLAAKLQQWKGTPRPHRVYSSSPGKRVSMRHALNGQARWVHRKESQRLGKIGRLLLVVDVSGSMREAPIKWAAHLVAALSKCAERRLVGGDVVLSTDDDERKGCWMRQALPWRTESIERMMTHNAEGLADTLRDNGALMRGADATYVFTDGCIGGRKIDHKRYARQGMRVTGLYCNDGTWDMDTIHEEMDKHFERYIVRSSVHALVDEMVSGRI